MSVVEKKKEVKVEKRKRIDRWGEIFIDRRVQYDSLRFPFEPDWNLAPAPLQGIAREGKLLSGSLPKGTSVAFTLPGTDISQDLILRPIQEQFFGNIYVFSDSEENLDDLDRKYKYLGTGFKNHTKQKKKLSAEKASASLVEA